MTYEFKGNKESKLIKLIDGGIVSNAVVGNAKAILNGSFDLNDKFNEFINKYELSGRVEVIDNETYIYINGKIAHAAMPELGKNALSYLLMFLSENFDEEVINHFAKLFSDYYGEGMGIAINGERMGKLTMNLGLGHYENNEYSFTINIRYPIDTTGEKVKEVLDSKVLDEGILISDSKPLYVDPNSPFIKTLLKAYQDISGDLETKPMTIGGGTYARGTINSVAFGMCFPNEEELAHQVNEVLSVDSLETGLAIYLEAIHLLGGL
jgi:succinyl-diaminopimelate desuccinylase